MRATESPDDNASNSIFYTDLTFEGVAPPPTTTGTEGDDLLVGTPEGEVIDALGGNDTVVASDGEEAIEAAVQMRPEVIVMDVVMPGMNGFQATRRLPGSHQSQNGTLTVETINCRSFLHLPNMGKCHFDSVFTCNLNRTYLKILRRN